jgi:hypothetical protein
VNLTTKERVKALMKEDSATRDALIDQLIAFVSADMEAWLRRDVQIETRRTDIIPVEWGVVEIPLQAYPVTAITSVRNNSVNSFSGRPTWVINEDYIARLDIGTIQPLTEPEWLVDSTGRPKAPTWFEVQYSGGMAADTASFITNYPALAGACDMQVRYLSQRLAALGGNVQIGDSGTEFVKAYDWLPAVARALAYERREA